MCSEGSRIVGHNTETKRRKLGQPEPPSESTGEYEQLLVGWTSSHAPRHSLDTPAGQKFRPARVLASLPERSTLATILMYRHQTRKQQITRCQSEPESSQ